MASPQRHQLVGEGEQQRPEDDAGGAEDDQAAEDGDEHRHRVQADPPLHDQRVDEVVDEADDDDAEGA